MVSMPGIAKTCGTAQRLFRLLKITANQTKGIAEIAPVTQRVSKNAADRFLRFIVSDNERSLLVRLPKSA